MKSSIVNDGADLVSEKKMAHKQNSQAIEYKSISIENKTQMKPLSSVHNRTIDANLHTKIVNLWEKCKIKINLAICSSALQPVVSFDIRETADRKWIRWWMDEGKALYKQENETAHIALENYFTLFIKECDTMHEFILLDGAWWQSSRNAYVGGVSTIEKKVNKKKRVRNRKKHRKQNANSIGHQSHQRKLNDKCLLSDRFEWIFMGIFLRFGRVAFVTLHSFKACTHLVETFVRKRNSFVVI